MITERTKKIYVGLTLSLVFAFCFPITSNAISLKADTGITYDCANENPTQAPGDCTFNDVISAIQKLLTWGRNFALAFSVVVLAYAGFKYMVSGDNAGERAKANQMFFKVAIGIFFILAAWLVVDLITNALLGKSLVNPF